MPKLCKSETVICKIIWVIIVSLQYVIIVVSDLPVGGRVGALTIFGIQFRFLSAQVIPTLDHSAGSSLDIYQMLPMNASYHIMSQKSYIAPKRSIFLCTGQNMKSIEYITRNMTVANMTMAILLET